MVENEIQKEVDKIEAKVHGDGDESAIVSLPKNSMKPEQILSLAKSLRDKDNFGSGKKWAGIYHEIKGTSELEHLQCEMWSMYNNSNSLYPGIFKSCRKFEAEIVQIVVNMLHGKPNEAAGLLTSGGTESILLAVLSYRELAKQRGIDYPEIICCSSAHGALDKACHYFNVKLVKIHADPKSLRLEACDVKKEITSNTIAVYTSAPSFPFGIIDAIADIAKITHPLNIGLHVDNCLGGFYLSSLKKLGRINVGFDFEVEGVTSISCDVHKYGYAPKGVSVIAFANKALRRLTLHPVTDGLTLYVTSTIQGSRSGAVIAAAWSTLLSMGEEGYNAAAIRMDDMKEKVIDFVANSIPALEIPVQKVDLAIVPICSRVIDIYAVATLMESKGWSTFTSQNPSMMQVCLGEQHVHVLDNWLADLKECAETVQANPNNVKVSGDAAVYGAAKLLPPEILSDVMKSYIEVITTVKPKKKI